MKAQEYRDAAEPTVEQTAKALRGRSAAKRDEATEQVKAVLVRANELGLSKHPSVQAIAVSMVMGDAKQLADTITTDRTAGFGNNTPSTSSHLAWVLHAIHKAENPWTPGGKGRLLSKDEFRAMKVRNGGHIPDGMSIKEAVAAGFLTADGKPVVHDSATLPDDIREKVDALVALGYTEDAAIRFVRTQ
tara:strand:+ start:731 stop:1297 length:567 start_codon:yes stop_codon:yes gene_type:complete